MNVDRGVEETENFAGVIKGSSPGLKTHQLLPPSCTLHLLIACLAYFTYGKASGPENKHPWPS